MIRTIAAIRRSIRAALTAEAVATRALSRIRALIAALYRAADRRQAVRIDYRKPDGTTTVRVIEPRDLAATSAGDITVRAHDQLRGEDRTFRIDRITTYTEAA